MQESGQPSPNKSQPAVYSLSRSSRCYGCDKKQEPGALVRLQEGKDEREVLCRSCARLDAFIVIPAGNAKITRLAKKQASEHYVILQWSELWKTYERKGLLVNAETADAIEREVGIKLDR